MPRPRIAEDTWEAVNAAYEAWDPDDSQSPSVGDLVETYGVSKQAFYSYRKRKGLPLKAGGAHLDGHVPSPKEAIDALLEALVRERILRMKLEDLLRERGIPLP